MNEIKVVAFPSMHFTYENNRLEMIRVKSGVYRCETPLTTESAHLKAELEELRERTERLLRILRDEWRIEASWDDLRRFWYVGLTEEGVRERDEREATLGEREEIVRCRDCVHFTANKEFWIEPPKVPFPMVGATSDCCNFWAGTECKVTPDGFCAWGERKDGDR